MKMEIYIKKRKIIKNILIMMIETNKRTQKEKQSLMSNTPQSQMTHTLLALDNN